MDRVQHTYVEEPAAPVEDVHGRRVVPAQPATASTRAVSNRSVVSPPAIAAGVFGAVLATFGIVAVARGGFDTPLSEPVVSVFGTTATTVSGLIVGGLGVLFLLAAVARSRSAITLFATVTTIAALATAIEPSVGGDTLGLSSGFTVLLAVLAALLIAVAAFVPTIRSTSEHVERVR